jgi:hypothetical protein
MVGTLTFRPLEEYQGRMEVSPSGPLETVRLKARVVEMPR